MFAGRLLAICISATALHFAPTCANFYLALCLFAIVICGQSDVTLFTIAMFLWAVEFYYITEYPSVFVAVYFDDFSTCYNTPISFFFVYDCADLMLNMLRQLFRHGSLSFA